MPDELGAHADAARAREALLVQRLAASTQADEAFVTTLREAHRMNMLGRQRLDAIRAEIEQAVANQESWALGTPAGARQFQRFLADKTRDIHRVVADAAADSAKKAELLQSLGKYYTAGFGRDLPAAPPMAPADDEPPKRVPEDPKEFHDFWERLTLQEKDRLYQQDHSIGNHPGMPFVDKDHYGRPHLDELTKAAQADVDRMQHRVDELARQVYMGDHSSTTTDELNKLTPQLVAARHRLDGYQAGQAAANRDDGVKRYVGLVDDNGHVAISIGDPDHAKRNAIFVPGTGQDMAAFEGSDQKSLAMYQAAHYADPSLGPGDVAVTTWMGYDRPMDLLEAAHTSYAHNGAAALDSFESGMRASHVGAPSIDTAIGHSYGSTLVGAAASGGHHLAVDNVFAVGSPGVLASHAADLDLNSGAQVFATRARNDIIDLATGWTLGPDPTAPMFGASRLGADPGPVGPVGIPGISIEAHSSYWDLGNKALRNMGAVIAGVPPPYVVGQR